MCLNNRRVQLQYPLNPSLILILFVVMAIMTYDINNYEYVGKCACSNPNSMFFTSIPVLQDSFMDYTST